jgi:hypothetical protein
VPKVRRKESCGHKLLRRMRQQANLTKHDVGNTRSCILFFIS